MQKKLTPYQEYKKWERDRAAGLVPVNEVTTIRESSHDGSGFLDSIRDGSAC